MTNSIIETIDGAITEYGDAMRWSPDPPEEREPTEEDFAVLAGATYQFTASISFGEAMTELGQGLTELLKPAFDRLAAVFEEFNRVMAASRRAEWEERERRRRKAEPSFRTVKSRRGWR